MRNVEKLEVRVSVGKRELKGVVLQEGRAASGGRLELFAPGACTWPVAGIELRERHGGRIMATVEPERDRRGRIVFRTRATAEMRERVRQASGLSAEFYCLSDETMPGGVREIRSALLRGAAFTDNPEYEQAQAEIRNKHRRERRW